MGGSQQHLVAVCDILGFSETVQKFPLENVVEDVWGAFIKALHHSLHRNEFPNEVPKRAVTEAHEHVGVAWFSDTVLLWSLRDDEEAVRQLIMTVGWLVFETMLIGRTRVRAGISYGEALIDRENLVFVGKAIVDAYRLEQKQQWSGAALTESACARIPEYARTGKSVDWWVIPYDVPLKNGEWMNTLAVNWNWGIHHPGWRILWSDTSDLPTDEDWGRKPDVCEKFINTKRFHEEFCRDCKTRLQ